MSIHPEGKKWRVKYRIAGKQRSRTFDRKGDARTFDAEVTRRRQLGPVLAAELERDTMTLDKVAADPSVEVEPLSPVEFERLIAGFSGRDRAIVLLAGHLGLRPIEIR